MNEAIELTKRAMVRLDSLHLQGVKDFEAATLLARDLLELKHRLEALEQKAKDDAALDEKRKARAAQLAEAEANGEEIVGGETVRIHADGSREVLIP